MKNIGNTVKITAEEILKGCEHDGSYIPVSEVIRLMQEYASLRTSKLEKDLKDAEAMFEKMELTAFNLDKRIKKLEELVSAHKNLLNCFGMSKPKNKTNIADLDEAWEGIAELEKELGI